jgi:hypothetical protein
MSFSEDQRFVVREDLLTEQVDDELVILDMDKNVYFGMNAVGKAVWALLPHRTYLEIVEELLGVYKVQREVLHRDVTTFLHDALAAGVIRRDASVDHG